MRYKLARILEATLDYLKLLTEILLEIDNGIR